MSPSIELPHSQALRDELLRRVQQHLATATTTCTELMLGSQNASALVHLVDAVDSASRRTADLDNLAGDLEGLAANHARVEEECRIRLARLNAPARPCPVTELELAS